MAARWQRLKALGRAVARACARALRAVTRLPRATQVMAFFSLFFLILSGYLSYYSHALQSAAPFPVHTHTGALALTIAAPTLIGALVLCVRGRMPRGALRVLLHTIYALSLAVGTFCVLALCALRNPLSYTDDPAHYGVWQTPPEMTAALPETLPEGAEYCYLYWQPLDEETPPQFRIYARYALPADEYAALKAQGVPPAPAGAWLDIAFDDAAQTIRYALFDEGYGRVLRYGGAPYTRSAAGLAACALEDARWEALPATIP